MDNLILIISLPFEWKIRSRETKQNEVNEFLGEYENVTWTEYVIRKLNDTVSTHSLQVDLGETMMGK